MASPYTRAADRRRLATEAMPKLGNDARTSIVFASECRTYGKTTMKSTTILAHGAVERKRRLTG
jgi:hypothetical protein